MRSSHQSSHLQLNLFNTVAHRSEYFKNSFIPNILNEWNKIDADVRFSTSCDLFLNKLLKFIKLDKRKTSNINDSSRTKSLPRLQLGFSYLCEQMFRHGFVGMLISPYHCINDAETISYCILPCYFYNANKRTLKDDLEKADSSSSDVNERISS